MLYFTTLIETAKANKLEPYANLRYIFDKLPTASSFEDYEALFPWNIALALNINPTMDWEEVENGCLEITFLATDLWI